MPADTVRVKFHPQVWRDNYAVTGDPFEFCIPRADATDDDGTLLPDNTAASDRLRDHPNAPKKARKWQGPFYVTVDD